MASTPTTMTPDELVTDIGRCLKRLQSAPGRILVAFSGGLDSSVTVDLLWRHHRRGGPMVELIHIDHGTRSDSAEDARFCRQRAAEYGLSIDVVRLDLPKDPGQQRMRTARLAAIAQHAIERGIDCVAFGHHGDDRLESFLLNLRRGTGLDGLAPMPPVDDYPIAKSELTSLRPLAKRLRRELEAYAHAHDIPHVTDPTNEQTDYERNRLRHEVLPKLAENPAVRRRLLATVDRLHDERRAADESCRRLAERAELKTAGLTSRAFDRSELVDAPGAEVARLFRRLHPVLDAESLERIDTALHAAGDSNAIEHLTLEGCVVSVGPRRVVFRPSFDRGGRDVLNRTAEPIRLKPLAGGDAPFFGSRVRWGLQSPPDDGGSPWVAAFDLDALQPPLRLVGFRPGMRLKRTDGEKVYHQKLTKLLSAHRIDADVRWRWPCVVDDTDRLVWAAAFGRGAVAKPDTNTTRTWHIDIAPSPELLEIIQF